MATCYEKDLLIQSLQKTEAYPGEVKAEVILVETHISWVFLAGDFAYKIKKAIRNSFIDYSTLALRKHYCEEELRLNQRFSKDLYIDVVGITLNNNLAQMGGPGEPIEYAVRMRRFPAEALLSHRVSHQLVDISDVRTLAARVGEFHGQASIAASSSRFGTPDRIYAEAIANCREITELQVPRTLEMVELLEHWTVQFFNTHQNHFQRRKQGGHIRECHGDLHLGNVVLWNEVLVPFDGIEFCDDFRWIDTLSDAAFTAMDFAALGRTDFCHSFISAYFESTGDYSALNLLPWYLVYRAMVRAKVAALRAAQTVASTEEHVTADRQLDAMLDLASRFTRLFSSKPQLWITYGLSGSGKTTASEQVLQRHGAIRIRADVERKRLAGLQPLDRVNDCDMVATRFYSKEMTIATYQRLAELAEQLLRCRVNVIVDATCLLKWQRKLLREVADQSQVPFRILAFHADPSTLRSRIVQRQSEGRDASDADLKVLEKQLESQQHLEAEELQYVAAITE